MKERERLLKYDSLKSQLDALMSMGPFVGDKEKRRWLRIQMVEAEIRRLDYGLEDE